MTQRAFRRWVRVSLSLVYLVIAAGATVRMTGSGMGCPDWPKCFGYYIPPTQEAQLLWKPGRSFSKGQLISHEGGLFSAVRDLKTGAVYDPANWKPYTDTEFGAFNEYHTWVEYLNRLIGALAGLVILVTALLSFSVRGAPRTTVLLSWLTVLLMGLQAWLGATVVYSVLLPVKVTLHMLMAFVLIALLLLLSRPQEEKPVARDEKIRRIALLAWGFFLIQVLLGTQTRQFVDVMSKILPTAPEQWLRAAPIFFYLHRSFSILVLLVYAYLFYRVRKAYRGEVKWTGWVLALLCTEALVGASMAYLAFPFGAQALHLLLSSLVFGIGFYGWIKPPAVRA